MAALREGDVPPGAVGRVVRGVAVVGGHCVPEVLEGRGYSGRGVSRVAAETPDRVLTVEPCLRPCGCGRERLSGELRSSVGGWRVCLACCVPLTCSGRGGVSGRERR